MRSTRRCEVPSNAILTSSPVSALAANPAATWGKLGVRKVIWMSALTTCFSYLPFPGISAFNVFRESNGFEMTGIHAAPNSTQMIQLCSFGNIPHEINESKTVGELLSSCVKFSIPVIIQKTKPNPASTFGDEFNVALESTDSRGESKLVIVHAIPPRIAVLAVAALTRCTANFNYTRRVA